MVFTGVTVTIHSLQQGLAAGLDTRAREFAIVPFTTILLFAGFFVAAIVNVRRPVVHMRLMLTATIWLLTPAFGRIVLLVLAPRGTVFGALNPPPVARSLLPSLLVDLVFSVAFIHDWRERGRPHRAYIAAGALMVSVEIGRVGARAHGSLARRDGRVAAAGAITGRPPIVHGHRQPLAGC